MLLLERIFCITQTFDTLINFKNYIFVGFTCTIICFTFGKAVSIASCTFSAMACVCLSGRFPSAEISIST